jgi:diguanylate cyclase (GGDEF)-like protein
MGVPAERAERAERGDAVGGRLATRGGEGGWSVDREISEDDGIVGGEHLGSLLPFLRESVLVFDRHGNLKARVGPPGGILGHALREGQNVFAHLHPDDVPRGIRIGDEARTSQEGWVGRVTVRLRHADGDWRWYRFEIHNRHQDPTIQGMVAVIREEDAGADPTGADPTGDGTGRGHAGGAGATAGAASAGTDGAAPGRVGEIGLPTADGATADGHRAGSEDGASAGSPTPSAPALVDLVAIAHGLPTAYLVLDATSRVRHASDAATELLACTREDLLSLVVDELVTELDRPLVRAAVVALAQAPGTRTVICATRPRFGGRILEAEFHTRGADAQHKLTTVVLVDHTSEPELVRLATHDPLTGLHNRTKVIDTLTGLLLEGEPVVSVVYVDLDDLKAINDTHGHETGDLALIEVAGLLEQMVRPVDLVGRMGGDEFVVVCPGMEGASLMGLVQRLGDAAEHGCCVPAPDGQTLMLTVSAGGATAVAGDTTSSLLARADEAMFRAKHGRNGR